MYTPSTHCDYINVRTEKGKELGTGTIIND